MEKNVALALLLLFTLLITTHRFADGQAFCRSQISLANGACSLGNFPGSRAYVPRQLLNETSTSTTTPGSKGYELRSRDRDDDDDEEGGEHEGRHRHRQRHRHSTDNSEMDPRDTACCRRLMAIDNSCICQAQASARLPVFMTTVWHVIKLRPVEGCEVTFECPGALSPLG